jgi:hypothetical protein
MKFDNPTAVKIGMTGAFSGVTYRVIGRVVMGVVDDGTAYYWNEFNLQAEGGKIATLVYEVTEHGGEWRLFTMFEPRSPITAADAATKRIGDPLNLDGTDVRVTLRDHSRVYHIEGQAPEGVDLGDVAEYFNAEAGNTMIVVSWTGDEVEFYHGVTISAMVVGHAFNLPPATLSEYTLPGSSPHWSILFPVLAGIGILVAVVCFGLLPSTMTTRAPAIVRFAAQPAELKVGSSGNLDGKNYRVVSDALVEISEVGVVFQRHEFHLRDENGNGALLIHGWTPGGNDWCLLTLIDLPDPITPQQAAVVECGQRITNSVATPVNQLFSSIILQVNTEDILQSTTGRVFYGFSGESSANLLLARWDNSVITFHTGHTLQKDPTPAFAQSAAK